MSRHREYTPPGLAGSYWDTQRMGGVNAADSRAFSSRDQREREEAQAAEAAEAAALAKKRANRGKGFAQLAFLGMVVGASCLGYALVDRKKK
jgi:hypothetical protein